jgi:hypothetical protein
MRRIATILAGAAAAAVVAASGWALLESVLPGVMAGRQGDPAEGAWRIETVADDRPGVDRLDDAGRSGSAKADADKAAGNERSAEPRVPSGPAPAPTGWTTWVPTGKAAPGGALIEAGGDDVLYLPTRPEPGTVHRARLVAVPALPTTAGPDRPTFAQLTAVRRAFIDGLLTEVPADLKAFDGRTVTLVGYVAVPFGTEAVSSFYLAADPWDACCIGKPPTLFDSVAVQLKEGGRLRNPRLWSTAVRGTFHVRPVYENETLIGLFSLTEAVEID